MILFYSPGLKENNSLPEEESFHCVKVLRHVKGDVIDVTDGKGIRYKCLITEANPRKTVVEVLQSEIVESPWGNRLILGIAPPKNSERMEWLLEKITEIGIDEIVPVKCERSERKEQKSARLEKIIVSAMKQSLKFHKPKLHPMTGFDDFVAMCESVENKFIGYCDNAVEKKYICELLGASGDMALLIGPEGDFSPAEIDKALKNGFKAVTLGDSRLRTETAALVGIADVHMLLDMKKLKNCNI